MLSIWRPYSVCIISRRGSQSLQIGPVGADRVNVIVVFTKAGEHDEIAFWRPSRKIINSGGQHRQRSIMQIDDSETILRLAPEAKYDPLAVWGPTRKSAVSLSLGELMEFRAVRAHQHDARWPAAARKEVETYPKSDPVIIRGPLRRKGQSARFSTKYQFGVGCIRIHYRYRGHPRPRDFCDVRVSQSKFLSVMRKRRKRVRLGQVKFRIDTEQGLVLAPLFKGPLLIYDP